MAETHANALVDSGVGYRRYRQAETWQQWREVLPYTALLVTLATLSAVAALLDPIAYANIFTAF